MMEEWRELRRGTWEGKKIRRKEEGKEERKKV